MLETLLGWLAEGGVHTRGDLATRLGVAESLVDQILDDLVRMGYLCLSQGEGSATAGCDSANHCAGCPLAGGCAGGVIGGRVWALTDKAMRLRHPSPVEATGRGSELP
jgi:hypothetical protein